MTEAAAPAAGRARTALLAAAALALVAAVAVLLAEPWRAPPGGSGPDAPAAEQHVEPLAAVPGASPGANEPADPPRAAVTTEPGARARITPETIVRGRFQAPMGIWPGGGHAALVPAPEMPEGGFLGAVGEMMSQMRKAGRADERLRMGPTGAHFAMETWFERAEPVARAALDPRGAFALEDPPPGHYELRLDHPLLRSADAVEIELARGETHDVGVLETRLAGSLLVLVTDANGQPVEGARLRLGKELDMSRFSDPSALQDMPKLMRDFVPREAKTDARGAHRFQGLEQPSWTLAVEAEGQAAETREVNAPPGRESLVRVELLPGAVLEALVLGPDGAPAADARLRLRMPGADEDNPFSPDRVSTAQTKPRRLRTGDDGVATARGLPAGTATVQLETPGYLPRAREVVLELGRTSRVELRLAAGETVSGRVLDESGAPIADAHVMHAEMLGQQIMGLDLGDLVGVDMLGLGAAERGVPVDADGRFTLGGFEPGEDAYLIAAAPGYDPARADVAAGTRDVELRLLRSTELRGVVVGEPGGAPIEAFEVRLEQSAWLMFKRPVVLERFEGRSDGVFTLTGVPREAFDAVVRAPGRAEWSQRVDLRDGSVDLGEVRLAQPAAIEGRTVDPEGRPLGGVAVRVSRGGPADALAMVQMLGAEVATSDDEGRFRLEGLSARRLRLVADKDGYAPLKSGILEVETGRTTSDVVLQLSRGGSLRGRVVDADGTPLSGWRVQVSELSGRSFDVAQTDEGGAFTLAGLAPGAHQVQGMPPDWFERFGSGVGQTGSGGEKLDIPAMIESATRWSVRDNVTIRDGEESEIELVFHRPDSGEGGLVDVAGVVRVGGVPLDSGMVAFVRAGSTAPRIATISGGRFELTGVQPGTFRAQVQEGMFSAVVGRPRTVVVSQETPCTLEIDLPGGRLEGRVVGEDDQPIAGAVLSLAPLDVSEALPDRADLGEGALLSDAAGRFRFEGLAPGSYDIFAKDLMSVGGAERVGRLAGIALAAGEQRSGLELVIRGGATLRIDAHDAAGPRGGALVTLLRKTGQPAPLLPRVLTDADGTATLHGVPAGSYRVAVDAARAAPALSPVVDVATGATRTVDIALRAGVEVVVALRGEVPARAAGAAVSYAVRDPQGALLRAGRVVVPAKLGPEERVALGLYAPGRYAVRLECGGHVVDREVEVPSEGPCVLELDAGDLLR